MLGPTVTALSLLSMDPSPAVAAQVQQAASTRHGLVNLTRLVRSLDKQRAANARAEIEGSTWLAVQKNWEMVLYARALLYALRSANEGSSSTAAALAELDRTLSRVEVHVQATAKQTRAPAPTTSLTQFELPVSAKIATSAALLEEVQDEGAAEAAAEVVAAAGVTEDVPMADLDVPRTTERQTSPILSPSPVLSPAITTSASTFNTSGYFAKRAREDAQGGEAGLLPLKVKKSKPDEEVLDQEGMRQRLLGTGAGRAIGASQLHEELGGQLVDMAGQLKKSALHFSNSLEEEKVLLQSSQDVLENNLQATKDSKGHLSNVSSKSRGTTCMTLGIVIGVIVLFIWTYLLIRLT